MADNNQIDDWEDIAIDDWEDVEDEEPIEAPGQISGGEAVFEPETSQSRAAVLGAGEGVLFGHAGEFAGAVEAGLDKAAQYGLVPGVDRSPTEVAAELEAQGVTGDIGPTSTTDLYRQSRQETEDEIDKAAKDHPKTFTGSNLVGSVMAPGAVLAKTAKGVSTTGKLLKGAAAGAGGGSVAGLGYSDADLMSGEDEQYGQAFKDMILGAGLGAGGGALGAGVGAGLGKGVNLFKNKQPDKIQDFLDPTSAKMGKYDYDKQMEYLTDEVLLPQKVKQKQINREEIRELVFGRSREAGETLGKLRKADTSLSKGQLQSKLQTELKRAEKDMDTQAVADFTKASKAVLPKTYSRVANRHTKVTEQGIEVKAKINKLEAEIASAKANQVTGGSPHLIEAQSKKLSEKEALKRGLEAKFGKLNQQTDKLSNAMEKMEDGKVNLDQIFNIKKNVAKSDHSDKAEVFMKKMEDELGGTSLTKAKTDYNMLEDLKPLTERSVGQSKVREGRGIPGSVYSAAKRSAETIAPFLKKHKEELKLAGLKPTSKIFKNHKWTGIIKDAVEKGATGIGMGLGPTIKMMQGRDIEFRKMWAEEQKEAAQEQEDE